MLKVGLTGGIATGKTHVARRLSELGCLVYDADQIARSVVRPGTTGLAQVVEEFGQEILTTEGTLDRAKLGSIVFADEARRLRLNQILHPLIVAELDKLIAEAESLYPGGICVIDAALMIETGSYKRYDALIVVYCSREEQLARLMKRNSLNKQEAEARIAAQMPVEEKIKYADYVIDTSGSYEQTRKLVDEIYLKLQLRCSAKPNVLAT
ncbi:MAG: dephospho-CoA kinase [Acidobacteriota bacterium]|nr:dephospho-CoA kinase [Blastocatellia bacterium]MDW8411521.1 dephospho-CoA kinase [Acidobacteriota bacterium]